MSSPRVVRTFHIQSKTSLLGKTSRKVAFDCPHCKSKLVDGEDEVGKSDVCPGCGGEFVLAKEAAEKIRKLNEEDNAEADRQASAEEQQREEAAATKRREQEAAAARRSEKEEDKADARRQQNAALQLAGAKETFRNHDIRQYPTLELLADIFRVLMWCAIILTVLWDLTAFAFVVFDVNDMRRMWWVALVTSVLWALPTAVAAFLLKLVSELIRLFINVAQDNERLVRLSEAQMGKPWAPK